MIPVVRRRKAHPRHSMEHQSAIRSRIVRYSLRTLVVLVAIAALLFAIAQPIYDWLNSTPLSQSVALFNDQVASGQTAKNRPLTEETVHAAIESELARREMPDDVSAILEKISKRNRLPRNVSLTHDIYYKGSTPGNPPIVVLDVSLVISKEPSEQYSIPICEIESVMLGE